MQPINQQYFTSAAQQVARGAGDPGSHGWPEPNGGMLNPRPMDLAVGNRYYRFASGTWPPEAQKYGSWWVEFEVLKKIARFAKEHSDARHAVRYFLALPWAWNDVDKIVSGFLAAPLRAYRGEGRRVRTARCGHPHDAGTSYIPPQHVSEIYQLYIPGMRVLGASAFRVLRTEDIWDNEHFRR